MNRPIMNRLSLFYIWQVSQKFVLSLGPLSYDCNNLYYEINGEEHMRMLHSSLVFNIAFASKIQQSQPYFQL